MSKIKMSFEEMSMDGEESLNKRELGRTSVDHTSFEQT